MKPANPNTDQISRSLLQKAVRRGYMEVATRVAHHLYWHGDAEWIKRRTPIILFEECWPIGSVENVFKYLQTGKTYKKSIRAAATLHDLQEVLRLIAVSRKWKDAAGLGSMAYEYSRSALTEREVSFYGPSNRFDELWGGITTVGEALKDVNKAQLQTFWGDLLQRTTIEDHQRLIALARQSYGKAGWPWDRAFMLAASYLTVQGPLPRPEPAKYNSPPELAEYWIAVDKHTPHGRSVLRTVAAQFKRPPQQLFWSSFYFESAKANESADSLWWECEMTWRLGKVGLEVKAAQDLWEEARPKVRELLLDEDERLRKLFSQQDALLGDDQNHPGTFENLTLF